MAPSFRTTEQENFAKLIQAHMEHGDAPLLAEGATGLGKTRAYLYPVFEAVANGVKVAIILPTHQLIDQLLASSDMAACSTDNTTVVAFKPKGHFESTQQYKAHREQAMQADILVCTSASVVIDQRLDGKYNGVTNKDYLLFDEADQLPEAAALQLDQEISAQTLADLNLKVGTVEQTASELLAKKHVEPEDRAAAKLILEAIENPAWYHTAGVTDDGGISLYHKMPGRLLKKISNQSNVAFVSATLSISDSFDDFKRTMGIDQISRFSASIEPSKHGTLFFHIRDHEEINSEAWLDGVLAVLVDAERPVLVVTPSHELTTQLGQRFTEAIIREPEETTTQAVARMPEGGVLVAAAAWAGLDTPVQWKSVVVPRIPFPRPTILDDNIESHYLNLRNKAIRRMRQVIGRGLRSPEAECSIYIHDPRWKQIESFVPARFMNAWSQKSYAEGARKDVILSKSERSDYLRKLAIRHYGLHCHTCDFVPKTSNQIDVHHKNPIAEGERVTTLEDLVPLCANCHRLAHSATPPLTLDMIQKLIDPNSSG